MILSRQFSCRTPVIDWEDAVNDDGLLYPHRPAIDASAVRSDLHRLGVPEGSVITVTVITPGSQEPAGWHDVVASRPRKSMRYSGPAEFLSLAPLMARTDKEIIFRRENLAWEREGRLPGRHWRLGLEFQVDVNCGPEAEGAVTAALDGYALTGYGAKGEKGFGRFLAPEHQERDRSLPNRIARGFIRAPKSE